MSLVEELKDIYLDPDKWDKKHMQKAKNIALSMFRLQVKRVYNLLQDAEITHNELSMLINIIAELNRLRERLSYGDGK